MKHPIKKILSLILVLCMTLLLGYIPILAEEEAPASKDFYILHLNDVHGRAVGDPTPGEDGFPVDKGVIGYGRVKTLIDCLNESYKDHVLVFDAGDTTNGTNFATLSKGQGIFRLMNEVGFDAMTLGNHEFNYGQDEVQNLKQEADFPLLASNIVDAEGKAVFDQHTIIEKDGVKFGVFGLATPETAVKASPKNTEGLEFQEPVEVAKKEVAALQEEGADVIILLAHLGLDEETKEAWRSDAIAKEVEGIDLIIDGHSHTTLEEGLKVGNSMIVSTGSHFENVGLVKLSLAEDGTKTIEASLLPFVEMVQYEKDPEIEDYIAAIEEENKRYTDVKVAELSATLEGEREDVRTGETNLADLIADAMLWATDADVVITNGGGIRASIEAGTVTMGDLLTVLPFGNQVTVIKVTGQDIIDALNYGTDAYPETAGKFPQVAGMSYKLVEGADGFSVEDVKMGDQAVDPEAEYLLATNDFMAIGGDGYTMFEGKEQVLLQGLMVDIVRDYIENELVKDGSFSYEMDGRITIE